ncbi:MAG: peptidoglycan DD-metalloendopeptidase family protein [Bacteroidetes bacterium]|nr:peptidoglycan DD-metalloendopeptidase family protein [Bacteroidota bacterium]
MKTSFTCILFFAFMATQVSAQQAEKNAYKNSVSQLQQFYNAGNTDRIFDLFDSAMQKALPLDKTKEFFEGLLTQAGKLLTAEFVDYVNGSYGSYKTTFEKGIYSLNISLDNEEKINGLYINPFEETIPAMQRNKTQLSLPFKGLWYVVWGGDTKELNYHVKNRAQKNAFDIIQVDSSGKSYRTDGKTNEDYYAFGKEIIAPCNGKVVQVVNGVKDNIPGEMNIYDVGGNTVIIQTDNDEYLVFCHFKHHSIVVKEGQEVRQGELLGLCGNTGNSSEPHLHFHIQNVENMNKATGIKCFFENIMVNGQVKSDYSPIQNDKIENIPN